MRRHNDIFKVVLVISGVLAAGCGSVSGLTGIPPVGDTSVPSVTLTVPARDSTVPAEAQISVTFSKPMNTKSIAISAQPQVAFRPGEWSADERTVGFRPQVLLSAGTQYRMTVTGRDKSGNALAPYSWSFAATAPDARAGTGALRLQRVIEGRADLRVFTLFAALNAAGYDAGVAESSSVRTAIVRAAGEMPLRVVEPVRRFRADHPQSLEAFIEYTVALGPPPGFAQQRAAGGLDRLNAVLADFYVGANVAALWNAHRDAYDKASTAAVGAAPAAMGRVLDYVRGDPPAQRIVLIPNLLDDPAAEYLVRQPREVLLVFGWRGDTDPLALTRLAARLFLEPMIPEATAELRRTDELFPLIRERAAKEGQTTWGGVVQESLIQAVTARLAVPADRREAFIRGQYARGMILAIYFMEALARYERTTTPLRIYLPELLRTIDLDEERRRFAGRSP